MKKTVFACNGKQAPKSKAQRHFDRVAKLRTDGAGSLIKQTADSWSKRQNNNAGTFWKAKNDTR